MARRAQEFQTIRSEGGLLPPDLLRRVIDPRGSLKGTRPEDYGLPQGERLNEVITQSWNRLRRHWTEFRAAAAKLPEGEAGTGLTNDKWSLPLLRELGFGLLPTSASPEIAGRTYAISRFFGSAPVHLVGCGLSLDRRAAGVRGAAGGNPHGLVQEVLNRSPDHLWGIVGNGLRLRILRDNQALSRQSFLEFDLEAMFSAEAYSDFVLLWLVAHATRFAPRDGNRIESCWLEEWTKEAQEQGTRALKDLRGSVERALQVLGEGFTSHPKNTALREALRSGSLPLADFHGQLLRVVYRLIFLFVAEDRTLEGQALLHPRDDSEAARVARERYAAHYGTARLRELAGKIKGGRHGDLWRQFQILVGALSGEPAFEATRRSLALPALGSFLWSPGSTSALNGSELTNHDLLEALRHLAYTRQGKVLRPVDYMNLGAEELGGVYESLLALTPQISADGARFTFAEFAGNERKTSGSYYTPDSLVQCLLDSALDPVVEEAIKGKTGAEAEQTILGLKVCDPAVGSGHFLVGAAHRLARHLSRVRALAQGESEPSPLLYQHALRDVIGRCLYGVDLNPMAAELCRVSLWLEALEPGKPLSFLDHHIRVGNSLLGTTPELIAGGLPDEAFNPIEGDDKKACTELKKRNRAESKGLGSLFVAEDAERAEALRSAAKAVDEMDDDTPEHLARKAASFAEAQKRYDYVAAKRLADAWCAAFVIRKHFLPMAHNPRFADNKPFGITQGHLSDLAQGRDLPTDLATEVERLARQYQFFHWHLAFPEVVAQGGFDCLLGNPPWDLVTADPSGPKGDELPRIQRMFGVNQYKVLSGRRDLYKLFLVQCGHLVSPRGNLGMLVPLGVFMEDESTDLRVHLFQRGTIIDLRHYQNGRKSFFDDVHASYRFCQIVWAPRNDLSHRFWTVASSPQDMVRQVPVVITASAVVDELGETFSAVLYQDGLHAAAHQRLNRVLWKASRVKFAVKAEFHASTDKELLSTQREADSDWIVLKNRNIHQFDECFAPGEVFVPAHIVRDRLSRKGLDDLSWFDVLPRLVFRDIARNDDERTLIACLAGPGRVSTYDTPMAVPDLTARAMGRGLAGYAAAFNAYLFDFAIRPYVDKHIKGYVLNRVRWPSFPFDFGNFFTLEKLLGGVLELSYTDWDLAAYARDLGWDGPPFRSDEERRFLIRCEQDAAFFHLYLPAEAGGQWRPARKADGCQYDETPKELAELKRHFATPRDAVNYIMDTFPIVRRKDEEKYNGDYRTKRVILEIYDAMQAAIRTGQPYQTRLEPPPGPPQDADGKFLPYAQVADNPPPHIHLPRDAATVSRVALQLSDLSSRFPTAPFLLRLGASGNARALRVRPVKTANIQASDRVVLASANLRNAGSSVPAAIGKLRVETRTDASDGSAYVLVTVRGDDGTAQARFSDEEWRGLTTIGVVDDSDVS